ncbi:hypothetical protein R6Q59_034216 [Mikania micrantha]
MITSRRILLTSDYLGKWSIHDKELEKATIVRLGLPWATIGNITYCGVFAMRYMEMVRSKCHNAFNFGFSTSQEEQRKQIEMQVESYFQTLTN